MKLTRREFFVKTVQGAAVITLSSSLITFLESCNNQSTNPTESGNLTTIQGTLTNGNIILNISSSSPLSKVGSAVIVNYNSGRVLVDHPSQDVFNALTTICTHQGCSISDFDSANNQFVCTCHGSRFSVDGKVAKGPASSALRKYPTEYTNNQLTIKIS